MKWAVVIVGLLIAASIAWFAGEQHYDNCVQAALASNPLPTASEQSNWDQYGGSLLDQPPSREEVLSDRRAELDDCSRLPF